MRLDEAIATLAPPELIRSIQRRAEWQNRRGKKFEIKKPIQRFPKRVMRKTQKTFRNRYRVLFGLIESELVPRLSEILQSEDNLSAASGIVRKRDAVGDDLELIIGRIAVIFGQRMSDTELTRILQENGIEASEVNKAELNRTIASVLPVDVFADSAKIAAALQNYVVNNLRLIKNLDAQALTKVQEIVMSGARQGLSTKEIASKIRDIGKQFENRADLIARDQLNKLNGVLSKERQTSIGVRRYVWRTSLDERVRGNPAGRYPNAFPSHWDREGKIFEWETPPIDGHPGEAINCRCYAEPIIEDLIEGL